MTNYDYQKTFKRFAEEQHYEVKNLIKSGYEGYCIIVHESLLERIIKEIPLILQYDRIKERRVIIYPKD